ncbi:MAG: response regulator transcription factor [Candidatus Dormibacter sp.]
MIRVLLADDQALVRGGFRMLLESADDIEVVGEAGDGEQAVALVVATKPDVVLMDIRMPGTDGLEATRRIAADSELAGVRVLILTTFEADEYVYQALRAGASGFLVKDTEPAELLQAVRIIARGDSLLSPSVTRRLIADIVSRPAPTTSPADLSDLTDREREVLVLVGGGLSNDEIAERLFLSPLTAKTHVSRIMSKLSARDRAQLVVTAYETGLVRAGSQPGPR